MRKRESTSSPLFVGRRRSPPPPRTTERGPRRSRMTRVRAWMEAGRHALLAVALAAAVWLAGIVPRTVSYRLGRLAGLLVWAVWSRGRRRSQANMLHVTGGDVPLARRYARDSFAHYGAYLVDFLRIGTLTRESIASAIDFDGWSLLERARAG